MSDSVPVHLDTSGLLCPLPVIRTQDKIKQLGPGDRLIVTATDPGTQQDIPAWCDVHGHELRKRWQEEDRYLFEIHIAQ